MIDLPFTNLSFGQVQVQVQVRPITSASFAEHLAQETLRIRRLLANRESAAPRKAVVIIDASVALMPPSEARTQQAEWLRQNGHLVRLVTHQLGFVLPTPILRGFVTAVSYLVPQPVPNTTHGSLDEAVAWAIQEAQNIGGDIDPELLHDGSFAVERARAKALGSIGTTAVRTPTAGRRIRPS